MTDLGFLNRQPEGAPSELTLDRYAAGELTPSERAAVERWLDAAPGRRAQVDARRAFPAPLEGEASERLFARIAHQLDAAPVDAPRPSRLAALLRRLTSPTGLGLLAAAAIALVVVVVSPAAPEPDELRAKGGFGFLVHRKTAAGSEVVVSGEDARAGDELRFEIDLSEPRFVLVLDHDPSGALSVAWPLDGTERGRLIEAGARALDGAIELDGALGDEWLIATSCPASHPIGAFAVTGPGRVTPPEGCVAQALLLKKVAR